MDLYSADGAHSGRVSAFRGEVNHAEGNILVEGDAVFEDADGRILRTEYLTYSMEKDEIVTDARTELTENGLQTVCGGGMIIQRAKNRQICRNPAGRTVSDPRADHAESSGGSGFESIFN